MGSRTAFGVLTAGSRLIALRRYAPPNVRQLCFLTRASPASDDAKHAERHRLADPGLVGGGHAAADRARLTRTDLAQLTGLARSTVSQRVDLLIAGQLVYEAGDGRSTDGRPPTMLVFNKEAGVVLAADLGATHARVAVTDLAGDAIAETAGELDIALGPDVVLDWVQARFDELLAEVGRTDGAVAGVGLGVPGPVEFATGTPVKPADHAGLGRRGRAAAVRGALPRPRQGRQRREHHGAGRALVRPP